MNVQNINNNRYNFTGLKFYYDGYVRNFSKSWCRQNKQVAAIDKELDKLHFDVKVRSDNRGNFTSSVVRSGNNTAEVRLLPNLAKVSNKDERIAQYPVDGGKTFDVMYDEIGADAESRVWEYNFGDRLLGQLQAALDVARKISKGY